MHERRHRCQTQRDLRATRLLNKITVDHHRAALALWNYPERSAKWIGMATRDSVADRILIGLRIAGTNGMT
jgi:hypothetical protein